MNFPEDQVWVAAKDWVKDLYFACDFVEGTIPLPSKNTLTSLHHSAQTLKASRFDIGILLPNSFSSALLFYLANIPQRWGYKKDGRGFLLTRGVVLPENNLHQAWYYLDLLSRLGLRSNVKEIKFPLTEDERRRAQEYLRTLNVDMKKPIIFLHPGAAYGPSKRWPVQKYALLADLFYERDQATIFIIGSLDEVETAESLSSAMAVEPINLAGKTSLRLLAGLISQASLFISNDSGPMHMANALKVPVVALFGPSDPHQTRPFQKPFTIIKKNVPCWPCSYRVCPYDHRCMMNIEPEEVYEAGKKCLG